MPANTHYTHVASMRLYPPVDDFQQLPMFSGFLEVIWLMPELHGATNSDTYFETMNFIYFILYRLTNPYSSFEYVVFMDEIEVVDTCNDVL